jgi:hypothetical protein
MSGVPSWTAPTWAQIETLVSAEPVDPDDAPGDLFNRRFMNWMTFVDPAIPLSTLVIPGTHESATYSMRDWIAGSTTTSIDFFSQTQSFNLLGQALAGVRYFDLRVEEPGTTLIFHHGSGARKDCAGRPVVQVLQTQVLPFLKDFPSEFLIFDFQEIGHYVGDRADTVAVLQDAIEGFLHPGQWAVPAAQFTGSLTMSDIWSNGWRYAVLFDSGAVAAAQGKVTLEDWVITRSPGSNPLAPGPIWDPWDESIWNGSTAGIIGAIESNGATWNGAHRPGLYVAQAVHTPTTLDTLSGDSPLTFEADEGYPATSGFNQWLASLPGQTTAPELNIVIRDAADWFPEAFAALMTLNVEFDNIAAAAREQLQLLIAASAGARFAPLLGRTETAAWFAKAVADGSSGYQNFQVQVPNSALDGGILEVGTPAVPGYQMVYSVDSGVLSDGASYDFAWESAEQGEVISWFSLNCETPDGDNGWFEVESGWVLQNGISIKVGAIGGGKCRWSIVVQTVSLDPEIVCYTGGAGA